MPPETLHALLALLGIVMLLMAGGVAVMITSRKAEAQATEPQVEPAVRRATGHRRMGRNQRGMRNRQRGLAAEVEEEEQVDDEDDQETRATRAEQRAAAREQQRAARDEARQAQQAAADVKDAKRKAYEERERAKEAAREAAEAAALEELQRAEQERLRREEEEAAQWMHLIQVEGEGQQADEARDNGAGLLAAFIDYIQGAKAVALDELAAEFRLSTAEVIKRIGELEQQGRLTGLMDDRGKFIYISTDEMRAVADFIQQRGRVSIAELAAKSDRFIDFSTHAFEWQGGEGRSGELDALERELMGEEGAVAA